MNSILEALLKYYNFVKSTFKNNLLLIIILIILFVGISYYLYTKTLRNFFDKNSNKEYIPEKKSKKNEATIFYFYTTWCPHCTEATKHINALENEIRTINTKQKDIVVFLKKIDCDQSSNEKILKKHNIKGYPTIILDHNKKIYNYEAKPNTEHLIDFVKDSLKLKDI